MNILIQANQEASLFILQIEVGIIFIACYYALLLSRLQPGAPALAALHPAALELHMSGVQSVAISSMFAHSHFRCAAVEGWRLVEENFVATCTLHLKM